MPSLPLVKWAPAPASFRSDNCVLVARSRRHSVQDFPGPLSIKTVNSGRVAWRISHRNVWVDESTFLILNDREPYSMDIDAAEPVSTCCIFFKSGFVENVFRDLAASDDRCLQNPAPDGTDLLFLNRLQPRTASLNSLVKQLCASLSHESSQIYLEECYLRLAAELVLQAEETRKQICDLPAARYSTRLELLRRVSRGRDYLHASTESTATLADAARAAAMSPFHFQRTFKTAFRRSPSKYMAELRFTRAANLLQSGASVTESALSTGFSSTASFSTAFRQWFGLPPSRYAAEFRKKSNATRS